MNEHTEGHVDVTEPLEVVLDVITDLASYPRWARQMASARVIERDGRGFPTRAELVMNAGVLKDELTLAYRVSAGTAEAQVTWHLLSARQIAALDGAYRLRSRQDGGTSVTYTLTVDPGLPVITALRRKAERAVIETALHDLAAEVARRGQDSATVEPPGAAW